MAGWNNIQDIVVDALVQAGQKITVKQAVGKLTRTAVAALSDIDFIIDWDLALADFSKTISEGDDSVSLSYASFKPIFCNATVGDDTYPLEFIHLTDLKAMTAAIDENKYPFKYSLAGRNIYVGPGLMAQDIVISGSYRRKLTINDIEYLPESLVIDRMLMRLLKPGTPEHIAAWSGWKEDVKRVQKAYSLTAEKRSNMTVDRRVVAFNAYLNSLE